MAVRQSYRYGGTTVISDERIDELERLANNATPGEWRVEIEDGDVWGISSFASNGQRMRRIVETDCGYYNPKMPDAAFIAASRTAVPELCAEVRRLRKELRWQAQETLLLSPQDYFDKANLPLEYKKEMTILRRSIGTDGMVRCDTKGEAK